MYYFRVFLISILSTLIGCVSQKVNRKILFNESQIKTDYHKINELLSNEKITKITWTAAVAQIENHNPTYLSSLESIQRVQHSKKQQWWRLAPRIISFANISSNLASLGEINSDNINASITSGLNIPNPFRFYAQLYANELQLISSQIQHEETRRTLQTQLFNSYFQQKRINSLKLDLKEKERTLSHLNLDSWLSKKNEITALQKSIDTETARIRLQLNRLFDTPGGGPWEIIGNPPSIDYSNKLEQIKFYHQDYGKLGHVQQAIQLELNNLNLLNVKFSRLPSLSFGASTPTLFSSDNNTDFDIDNIRLFTGISKSFSFDDPLDKKNLRDTTVRLRRTKMQLQHNIAHQSIRLNKLKSRYKEILEKKEQTTKEINSLQQEDLLPLSIETFTQKILRLATIEEKLATQESQKSQIELEIWRWDETYWKYFN